MRGRCGGAVVHGGSYSVGVVAYSADGGVQVSTRDVEYDPRNSVEAQDTENLK
jgi:hypothetical protein